MPYSDLHTKKKAKNLVLLAAMVAFMLLIFAVTIVRMAVQ